ncbi:MAG: MBL fold metallo-hydrolase [Bacillota bacterium]
MFCQVLVDNRVMKDELIAEHGISFWLEYKGTNYIFDTGQEYALIHNAEKSNILLQNASGIFLSHSHEDHVGALDELISLNNKTTIYGHKKVGEEIINKVEQSKSKINFVEVTTPREIEKGLWLTGQLSSKYLNEVADTKYYEEAKKENSLFLETEKGLIVLSGCSHAGIANILKYIQELTGKSIYGIAGGFHFIGKSDTELTKIIDSINKLEVKKIYPLHCTGFNGQKFMKDNCTAEVQIVAAGDKIF